MNHNIKSIEGSINSIAVIQNHLQNDLPYHDSLNNHFGNSSKYVVYLVNSSVYENIKFSGLDIISDDSLRNQLVFYYDYSTSYLNEIEKGLFPPNYHSFVIPTMIKKFDYAYMLSPAVPHNYEGLKNDREYLSLLKTTIALRGFQIKRTQMLIEETQSLQNQVRKELRNLLIISSRFR